MTTFAERKQARIAAGPQDFRFVVMAGFPYDGEELGTFASRKQAHEFAFAQRSPVVGITDAMMALEARHPNNLVSLSMCFQVVRMQVEG